MQCLNQFLVKLATSLIDNHGLRTNSALSECMAPVIQGPGPLAIRRTVITKPGVPGRRRPPISDNFNS